MKKIALGLLFVLIPIPLYLISGYTGIDPAALANTVNLVALNNANFMPAFVGYLLILWGLGRSWPSDTVSATRILAIGSALVSGGLWFFVLGGQVMAFPLEQGMRVLITWRLLKWCEEQESWDWGYRLRRLRMSWYALTGATAAAFVLGAASWTMGTLWSGVALGTGLYYTYTFYRLARMVPKA